MHCLRKWICAEVTRRLKHKWFVLHINVIRKGGRRRGRNRREWDVTARDSDWHVARRHWSVSWRTCRLTTLHVSGPGTLPVSSVGGLLTRVWMCMSWPSGVKLLLNAHPRNDTDTVPSCSPQSPDGVPGEDNLYLFPLISLNLSPSPLLALPLSESITHWLTSATVINWQFGSEWLYLM